jgi:ppGpp synthetase/RelA/SpoT-type nucleotidyltranferase
VHDTLKNHIAHYHAQAREAEIEILEKYKGRSGFFMKKFLIGAEYNMNQWRTPWHAIKKDVWGFEGKPVVLTPARDHPRVHEQDNFKIGEIVEVGLDETKQIAWQISQITDKRAQRLIREKKVRFGSPTVLKYSDATTQEMKLGDGRVQTTLNRFIPAHDAIVGEPAYGKQVDYIPAICDGTGKGCALKLQEVSAAVINESPLVEKIISREHQLLDKGIPEEKVHEMLKQEFASDVNSDNTNQVTIVPFVKKTLNSNFNHKTLSQMVDYSKRTRQGSSDSCVSRKISILADEHPDWDQDQVIAVAYAYCKKDKSAEFEKSILGDLTPEILMVHEKIRKEDQQKANLINAVEKVQGKLKQFKAADIKQWITVKGNHIPIEEGETKEQAIEKFLRNKGDGPKKVEPKLSKDEKITSRVLAKKHPNLKPEFIDQQMELGKTVLEKASKSNNKWQNKLKTELPGDPTVSGRTKDIASAIGKASKKPKYKDISLLQDNSGLRAEYDDVTSVKQAMKFVKSKYNVIDEDNYIDEPKFDGYRSYHAIIKDEDGQEMELQVRTKNETKWADWAHDVTYKPPNEKIEKFVEKNKDLVTDYSLRMSDYLFDVDMGKNVKKPECPPEINEVDLCI